MDDELLEKTIQARKVKPYTDRYQRVLDILTPETIKRELLVALQKIENISDPRIYNCPLPNDAKPTMCFGAIAYVFDGYPGFVWRLGHWFKITATLRFSPLPDDELNLLLFKPFTPGKLYKDNMPDSTMTMDAAFYPVKIDGIRFFLREYWIKNTTVVDNKLVNFNDIAETVMYMPELQACVKCAKGRRELQNYSGFEYEDSAFISKIKCE